MLFLKGIVMRKFILGIVLFFAALGPCFADSQGSATGGTAGTQSTLAGGIYQSSPPTLSNGQQTGLRTDSAGNLLTAPGAPGTDQDVNLVGINGAAPVTGSGTATGALRVELPTNGTGKVGLNAGTADVGNVGPAQRTLVTLAIKTVTTGGTAVNAMAAGGRTAGGFLQNPKGATIDLCINEIGTATGTTSSGDTTCIAPGQSYAVAPASTAVSVISSDSSHPFSGYGLQ